ncbi:flavocytochrome c [Dictyocaulus viviparus]|uniref:Flavocytochrome c n=1 Tax=Dictyocaulus viviparus TaxID=29172 RepID=A0A0D8Y8R2_DICVI|nr:flavocytochrome c [Dictyocaulus viviparus]
MFDKDHLPSESCSPATSNCSFISSIADSETSSRSSLDGSFFSKESSSEGMEKFRVRRSVRKLSSSSSDSDGSELTVGGGSLDGDEPIVRKISKTKLPESNLPVARRSNAPRGRIANIRRESDCSLNNEVEHERLVKTSQQVSCGFDDITLEKSMEMRRRIPSASSIGEPISIVTNVFLPHSCSPSPTRVTDMHKQCYSPSTHQMVRPNIPYSATPSPTQSPTRQKLLRSQSPITTKTSLKRRYASSADDLESKRSCVGISGVFVRNSTSPLVTDRTFPYPTIVPQEFAQPNSISVNWTLSSIPAGNRRVVNLESITECCSANSSDIQQNTVDDGNKIETEMGEEMSSEAAASQSSIIVDQTNNSTKCDVCTDECNCLPRNPIEENQSEQVVPSENEPIIIVGGGLAGLSAAIEALNHDAKVIIIDSEKALGGNSAKASSGINACGTKTQEKMGIKDSRDLFFMDTMNAGDRENDEGLVDILIEQSSAAIEFLMDLGVDLSDVNLCGGHSVPRTHWIPSPKEGRPTPVGLGIINAAKQRLDEISKLRPNNVTIITNTRVVGLTSWNAYVNGVNVVQDGKRKEINGKAVILATGGFSADKNEDASLLREFANDKLQFPTTNGVFARGDGVKMARAMGAEVVGMNRVQIHPTAFVDPTDPSAGTKFLAAEALRGKGAILVSFIYLFSTKYLISMSFYFNILPQGFCGGSAGFRAALMIMNDEAADSFGRPAFNFYANIKKFFTVGFFEIKINMAHARYDSAAEFATASGIPLITLKETLLEYNKHIKNSSHETNEKDSFGKTVFPVAIDPNAPLYVAVITPAIHYTMGGLKIDKQARVYNEFISKPFEGLLAAGEVTGGVHGANRLAGNSLLECVMDRGQFIHVDDFDFDAVDMNSAPRSAEHYLQQVIVDRFRSPSCVSINKPDVSTTTTVKDFALRNIAERDSRAPPREWCQAKVAEFSLQRLRMERATRNVALKLPWPNMVIVDRFRSPSCVSINKPDVSTTTTVKDFALRNIAERDSRAPPREWCQAKVAEFSLQRLRMEKATRNVALKLPWPNMTNAEEWEELLLRRCHPKCVHFLPSFPNHRGTPPATPVVFGISFSMVNILIPYAVEWAECDEFSRALREWLFALLLIVQKPLLPDVCAAIRGLANLCRKLRSSLDIERKDEIRELSWFIAIVGEYFGQTDLSDL